MMMPTTELLWFLAQRVPGLGRGQAMHLVYLTDVEARRHFGQPLTQLSYIWSDAGPLDSDVLACLDELEQAGNLRAERTIHPAGRVEYRYFSLCAAPSVAGEVEQALLEHIVLTFGAMGLEALQEEVRNTRPVRDALEREAVGRRLRMDLIDGEARIPGLELVRLRTAVAQLDAGIGKSHQEVFGALSAPSGS